MRRQSVTGSSKGAPALLRLLGRLFGGRPATTIQGFWHGTPLTPLHWACLNSFLDKGHRFDLYTYQDLAVPRGVRLRDAGEILPQEEMFFFANPHTGEPDVAPFVDYFRLFLLYQRGGWWCDVDTVCLSADLPQGDRAWAQQAPEYRPGSVSNGELYLTRNDSLLKLLIEEANRRKDDFPRRESLGPELFTSVLNELGLPLDVGGTADTFYPLRFIENFKLWLPEFNEEVQARTEGAVFLPIYQSFPARLGFANDKLPPKGSYLRKFMWRHASEFSGPSHSTDDFRTAIRQWFHANPKFIPALKSVSQPNIERWLNTGLTGSRRKAAVAARRRRRRRHQAPGAGA